MNIKVAKLLTGEIVIGLVIKENEIEITFKNLFQITLVPFDQKNMRISIIPLHPFAQPDEKITINHNHVLFWIDCPENILNEYKAYTGTVSIVEQKNNLILPS